MVLILQSLFKKIKFVNHDGKEIESEFHISKLLSIVQELERRGLRVQIL